MDLTQTSSSVYGPKVVVFCAVGVGHMNPMLNILRPLCNAGGDVTVFADMASKSEVEDSGATFRYTWESFVPDGVLAKDFEPKGVLDNYKDQYMSKEDRGIMPFDRVIEQYVLMESHLSTVRSISPDIIVWDTFCLTGYMCSQVLGIKGVSIVTFSGLGIFSSPACQPGSGLSWNDVYESRFMEEYGTKFMSKYGLNPFKKVSVMQAYSHELNIVTLIEPMTMKLRKDENDINYKLFSTIERDTLRYVGPCVSEEYRMKNSSGVKVEEISHINASISRAKSQGQKIIFFALGTVITGHFWDNSSRKIGGAESGKELFHEINNRLINILGNKEGYFVIVATGTKASIDSLPKPKNFLYCHFVNQMQVLKQSDLFISHCGANSTNEAVIHGVPVIPIPGFADQTFMAKMLAQNGSGVLLWDENDSFSGATENKLKEAIKKALSDEAKSRVRHLQRLISNSRGGEYAASILLEHAQIEKAKPQRKLQSRSSSSCATMFAEVSLEEKPLSVLV